MYIVFFLHFWATVCKTVRLMLSDHCPVCLSVCRSVTLVYCGQTIGRIKMKLGTPVGLGPRHIVLDGNPAPPSQRGTAAPHFSVAAKWLHGSRCHLVRRQASAEATVLDGDPASPPPKGGGAPKKFRPCLLWPNGWMDQDGTWHGGRP